MRTQGPGRFDSETRLRSGAECRPAQRVMEALLGCVEEVTESCDATRLFVHADVLGGHAEVLRNLGEKVVYVVKTDEEQAAQEGRGHLFIRIPNVPLARMAQAKMAIFRAVPRGIVRPDDIVVCLTGTPINSSIDTLSIIHVGPDFEIFLSLPHERLLPEDVHPDVVDRIIDIATELGVQGREGKPVGALFVVGDSANVLRRSRPLILNPFQGHAEEDRSLLSPGLEETVKEMSVLDGAMIIRGSGILETCGVHLEVPRSGVELGPGLGARHQAAAAITRSTRSLAVAVSESTGAVTIFRSGQILTVIQGFLQTQIR